MYGSTKLDADTDKQYENRSLGVVLKPSNVIIEPEALSKLNIQLPSVQALFYTLIVANYTLFELCYFCGLSLSIHLRQS